MVDESPVNFICLILTQAAHVVMQLLWGQIIPLNPKKMVFAAVFSFDSNCFLQKLVSLLTNFNTVLLKPHNTFLFYVADYNVPKHLFTAPVTFVLLVH